MLLIIIIIIIIITLGIYTTEGAKKKFLIKKIIIIIIIIIMASPSPRTLSRLSTIWAFSLALWSSLRPHHPLPEIRVLVPPNMRGWIRLADGQSG